MAATAGESCCRNWTLYKQSFLWLTHAHTPATHTHTAGTTDEVGCDRGRQGACAAGVSPGWGEWAGRRRPLCPAVQARREGEKLRTGRNP